MYVKILQGFLVGYFKKICCVHQNEPALARHYRGQEQDGNFVTNVVNNTEKNVENAIFSCKM